MPKNEDGWNNAQLPAPRGAVHAFPTPQTPAAPATPADGGGAVLAYWQLIKRRKLWILLTGAVGALIAFVMLILSPPVYVASTSVEMQSFNESFMNLSAVDPLAGNYSVSKENIATAIRIIQSGSIRGPVIDRLRRETAPVAPPYGGTLAPMRKLFAGKQDPLVEMRRGLIMASATLKAQVVIGTRLVVISAESTIPDLASGFVNAVVAEYIAQTTQQRTVNTQRTSQWLETQLEETRTKVEQAETRMQEFVRKNGLTFATGDKDTLATTKLHQLQGELGALQADRIAKQAKLEQIKSSPPDALPDLADDVVYKQDQIKLAGLRQDLAKLNETLTPANPRVQRAQAAVVELTAQMQKEKEAILQRYRNDYDAVLKHEQLAVNAYAGQAGTVSAQSDKSAEYDQLKREVDLYLSTFNTMMQQLNQSAVASALPTTNARVIDAANPPSLPSKPEAKIYELYGILGGIGFGIVLVLGVEKISEWRSSLIFGMPGYSPRVLKVPELGVIPSIESGSGNAESPARRWTRLLPGVSTPRAQPAPVVLLNAAGDGSIQAESFRLTLTSLLLMSRGARQPRVIVVTSPGPGEGKTTVASNMAIAVAETGRKVLVIDADLRRPRMHAIFGIETNEGLGDLVTASDLLNPGEGGARNSAQVFPTVSETRIPGVFVLPAGATSDLNLSQVFHSPAIPALLDKLVEQFDLILIDTPPMIQFSDARLMARFADGLILVVRSGVTARQSAVTAREQLAQDNINVLGTILNDWDAKTNLRNQSYYPYSNNSHYQKTASGT
ncbi:MAG TPA: polysaccharide biosynthesis tyrosine autokinase [Bryobacteraceae bacterium]|nr:polysaccharide biosynthesis tyrosine autokinase [Bryobacteraceae bacterium]